MLSYLRDIIYGPVLRSEEPRSEELRNEEPRSEEPGNMNAIWAFCNEHGIDVMSSKNPECTHQLGGLECFNMTANRIYISRSCLQYIQISLTLSEYLYSIMRYLRNSCFSIPYPSVECRFANGYFITNYCSYGTFKDVCPDEFISYRNRGEIAIPISKLNEFLEWEKSPFPLVKPLRYRDKIRRICAHFNIYAPGLGKEYTFRGDLLTFFNLNGDGIDVSMNVENEYDNMWSRHNIELIHPHIIASLDVCPDVIISMIEQYVC